MKITVHNQTKQFYLAFHQWTPAVGHEIQVGKFRFSAVVTSQAIHISEVTTGTKVFALPLDASILSMTQTKEDTYQFYKVVVGEQLHQLILKNSEIIEENFAKLKAEVNARLGEMPAIEIIDTSWIEAEVSDTLN